MDDDKYSDGGDRITVREFDTAMMMAQTEPRAKVSCALTVIHRVWESGDWRKDVELARMLFGVLMLNESAGIREGMTDRESDHYRNMIASVRVMIRKGGAS